MNVKKFLKYVSALLIALLLITLSISCKNQVKLKLQEIEQQFSQEYRQELEEIEDKEYITELLSDDELISLLYDVFVWKEGWFYKLTGFTGLEFSNDELKLIIKTAERFSDNDQYRLKYLEYLTAKNPDIYLSSLSIKERSELFEKLYKMDYQVENIPNLFANIKQSLQDNNEEAKISLLSDPILASSEEFLLFYKTYVGSESEKQLIDFINDMENLSYLDKLNLFKKFRNLNVLELVDEIKSQDNQIYEDILGINKLGFFNISNFTKKGNIKEFISYMKETKTIDRELYESYIKYDPESFLALQEISKYYGEDKTLDYRPTPDSVLKLYNIILDIPEEYRLDYIENSFRSAFAVIVKGSEDLDFGSLFISIDLFGEFNIDSYIFTNSLEPYYFTLTDPSISSVGNIITDIEKISQSIEGQTHGDINTEFKTKASFLGSVKDILESNKVEKLYFFINTHGDEYSLWFGPGNEVVNPDYEFLVFPSDLVSLLDGRVEKTVILLESCHSNKFSKNLRGYSNIEIVSGWDGLGRGGDDFVNALLVASYNDDTRITMEELGKISDHVSPDYIDSSGYHYVLDSVDIVICDDIEHELDEFEYDLDIQIVNNSGESSIIYYHVDPLEEHSNLEIANDISNLIEEDKFQNIFKGSVPEMEGFLNGRYSFSFIGEYNDNTIDYYEWYLKNIGGIIRKKELEGELPGFFMVKNGRLIDFTFQSDGIFVVEIFLNDEDIMGFNYEGFKAELLPDIPLAEGMTVISSSVEFKALIPDNMVDVFEKYKSLLDEESINYQTSVPDGSPSDIIAEYVDMHNISYDYDGMYIDLYFFPNSPYDPQGPTIVMINLQ